VRTHLVAVSLVTRGGIVLQKLRDLPNALSIAFILFKDKHNHSKNVIDVIKTIFSDEQEK